jgi:uncharacterized protein YpbB
MQQRHIFSMAADEKRKQLSALIDGLAEHDSVAVIISRPTPSGSVQGEAKTFIHPDHITSQANTMADVIRNLHRAQAEDEN